MESRQLFNIHKICIVKHASNVCYMRPKFTQPLHISPIDITIRDIPIQPFTLKSVKNFN
jgi:hypothetical protein